MSHGLQAFTEAELMDGELGYGVFQLVRIGFRGHECKTRAPNC